MYQYGYNMVMPARPLGVRFYKTTSGNEARVMFTVAGGDMVLLHGFVKKSGKTPENDLDTARRRKNEVLA